MKINKKILYGLGALGLAAAPIVGVLSCGESEESKSDQDKLNKITGQQVQDKFGLKKGEASERANTIKQPDDLSNEEINKVKDVNLKINNWKVDETKGEISFTTTISKTGLTSKEIDIMIDGYRELIILTQDNRTEYSEFDNAGDMGKLTIKNNVNIIGDSVFKNGNWDSNDPLSIIKSIEFEANNMCEEIELSAFENATEITQLTIADSVTTIDALAFADSPLTTLTLGNSITTIGDEAFRSSLLTTLTIPDSVTTIGESTFLTSVITTLTLGNSVTTIGTLAFSNASLDTLIIPDSVTTIGDGAFENSQLTTSFTLGNSVTTIGDGAFSSAELTTLTIPNSVTTIGNIAFNISPLTTLTLGNSVTTIGDDAFKASLLENLIIPDSITAIGKNVFWNSEILALTFEGDSPSAGGRSLTLGNEAFINTSITAIQPTPWQDWATANYPQLEYLVRQHLNY